VNLLVIDTSTELSQVILAQSLSDFEVIRLPPGLTGSQYLFDQLNSLNFKPQSVAVTVGPGSYTGIRVGLAAAQGIAKAGKLPLVGLCSLEGFISGCEGPFLSLIDARGGGVYMMEQKRVGASIVPVTEPMRCALEELPLYLHVVQRIVGPRLSRFDLLPCEEGYADPAYLVARAYHKLQLGHYGAQPNYLDV